MREDAGGKVVCIRWGWGQGRQERPEIPRRTLIASSGLERSSV